MQYRTLGRTGLRVSLLSLGTGGARRMGQRQGLTQQDQDKLVRRSLDLGINLFDTSPAYGLSEEILGKALSSVSREDYILCSKCPVKIDDTPVLDVRFVYESVETSLRRLGTDCIDIMLFQGMPTHQAYQDVVDRLYPGMERLREQGKIRFTGFSEPYVKDPQHKGVLTGLQNHPKLWDVLMLKYGILNQIAAKEALPLAIEYDVGILNMAAVRIKLPDPVLLEDLMASWKERGDIPVDGLPERKPLDWLVHGEVDSIISAAYKFAADHAAIATVVTGTATIAHLEENAAALERPVLPRVDKDRVIDLFGDIVEYV
ncbi:MAG: aldo/keto reductase [Gemmatimonadota bacterium]|nr:aldo/keto reductase [Gemmatimonadota bacterium]